MNARKTPMTTILMAIVAMMVVLDMDWLLLRIHKAAANRGMVSIQAPRESIAIHNTILQMSMAKNQTLVL